MSLTIQCARIKCFSEEFTEQFNYMQVLDNLKKLLQGEENVDQILVEKFIEDIDTTSNFLLLSGYDSTSEDSKYRIDKFLETDSKVELHPKSKFYFVTEEFWGVLQEKIWKNFLDIKEPQDKADFAEDFTKIKSFYDKKMLLVEVVL